MYGKKLCRLPTRSTFQHLKKFGKMKKYVCIYCVQKGESNLPLWRSKQPQSIILLRNVTYIPAVVHRGQVRARLEAEEELLRRARHGPVETETVQQLQQRVALVLRVLIAYIHTYIIYTYVRTYIHKGQQTNPIHALAFRHDNLLTLIYESYFITYTHTYCTYIHIFTHTYGISEHKH
jgi:hypothetical protein